MTKVLMVCLGNICRSPLAHGILESKLPKDSFYVDSAGTANYHVGHSPDKRSILVAKQNNIDISHQQARQFKTSDFKTFNYIYVMDQSNYNNVVALAKKNADIAKVKLILEEDSGITNKRVPDPYYGDISDFEHVFELLDKACTKIATQLINKNR